MGALYLIYISKKESLGLYDCLKFQVVIKNKFYRTCSYNVYVKFPSNVQALKNLIHRACVRFYCISLFQTILQQNNQQTINRVILCHVGSISMFKLVFLSFIAFPCTSFELITFFPRKNIHNDFTFVNQNLKVLYKIRHDN